MTSSPAVVASREPLSPDAFAGLVGEGRQLSRLEVVPASPSTNSAMLAAVHDDPGAWPHFSALIADHQTAGRGRAGRGWATPQGAALTVSVLLRPEHVAHADLTWAPLVVGLATVRTLRDAGVGAWLKWPNDVVVEAGAKHIAGWGHWRKCVGILCEVVPGQAAIVAGVGINVSQTAAELPVPHAASLATLGAPDLSRVALMRSLVANLQDAVTRWDMGAPVREDVESVCASIGWHVSVDVPGGSPVSGTVTGLGDAGELLVQAPSGETRAVMAGDVRVRSA
jgi:BirA family biotin operon repressor/biotin-[acetyl-CoA-carboxylase] ligase